jgi:histidyl-tRNA synthetase
MEKGKVEGPEGPEGPERADGYIVPYDIPSENLKELLNMENDNEEAKNKKTWAKNTIRSKRVIATNLLHSLGILTTNSVVLVPKTNENKIDSTIQKVREIYNELNNLLEKEGFDKLGEPIIKKIPLMQQQIGELKELAEKQLIQRLNERIDQLASLISEISNMISNRVEEEKRRRMIYNLRKEEATVKEIERMAKELNIEADNQFSLLSSLISQAINELEGK